MKLYLGCDDPVGASIKAVLELFCSKERIGRGLTIEFVLDYISADLIVVGTKHDLAKYLNPNQHFAVFSISEVTGLPNNARYISIFSNGVLGLLEYIQEISLLHDNKNERLSIGIAIEPTNKVASETITRDVLVIDDVMENLQLAVDQLGSDHRLTLANSYDLGMNLIAQNDYDAVLTDCQMPVGMYHTALSPDDMSMIVHNGLMIVFFATKRGAHCAVVTDGNHHRDWVSAAFDDMRESYTLEGLRVRFFNNGKNWAKALESLFD